MVTGYSFAPKFSISSLLSGKPSKRLRLRFFSSTPPPQHPSNSRQSSISRQWWIFQHRGARRIKANVGLGLLWFWSCPSSPDGCEAHCLSVVRLSCKFGFYTVQLSRFRYSNTAKSELYAHTIVAYRWKRSFVGAASFEIVHSVTTQTCTPKLCWSERRIHPRPGAGPERLNAGRG